MTTNILIQELHQFTWIKTVFLSKVDKETTIACFCLTRLVTLLFASSSSSLFSLTSSFFLLTSDFRNLWGISIISQELTKLHRDDLLDEVFFVDILEITIDILHERGNLLFIDICLHNLIHHLVELFLANLLGRRNLSFLESLANLFLDITDLMLLTRVYDTQ